MYSSLQAKLLRVLQERTIRRVGGTKDIPINIRVVAATNRDLKQRIDLGTFREDLFYRLNVVPIHLPPLRERENDVLLLAKYFLEQFARLYGKGFRYITPDAEERLLTYRWPGNVRELRNLMERICIMASGPVLEATSLPLELQINDQMSSSDSMTHIDNHAGLENAVASFERNLIQQALTDCNSNVVQAALKLKIPRGTLRYKMEKYGLPRD
jgi:transcriptional regulator with PAS, ATPase and Fis domain